ncbi:MAG: NAD(P)/FAD-dependent oxidoreductase, partial [Spirochaetota bacterium]
IVDMLSSIGEGSYLPNLIDVLTRVRKQGTELLPGYKLSKITKDSIELVSVKTGETAIKAVDHVVLSTGVKPNNEMVEALEKKFTSVRVIGDAGKPGRIGDAVRQGFEAAWVS